MKRRTFIKGTIGAGIAISGAGLFTGCNSLDSKDLPTAILGKTGVKIPQLALGLGSRFCQIEDPEETDKLLSHALDLGLYYWDTAFIYEDAKKGVISEDRIGRILKSRRKEVFVSTKVTSRDPDEAMKQIETSLKRLQTDHVDILKIHDIKDMDDVEKMSEKGNLVDILYRLKKEGVTRFIGFSGHSNSMALEAMAKRFDFDTMLVALNHYGRVKFPREEEAVPTAYDSGLGVMIMKLLRPRDNDPSISPTELIRYGLSLGNKHGAVIGVDSIDVLNANVGLLKNFKPMTPGEMKTMTARLTPFYHHKNIPWMKPGYCDGNWG
jgi:uncharacterized protein